MPATKPVTKAVRISTDAGRPSKTLATTVLAVELRTEPPTTTATFAAIFVVLAARTAEPKPTAVPRKLTAAPMAVCWPHSRQEQLCFIDSFVAVLLPQATPAAIKTDEKAETSPPEATASANPPTTSVADKANCDIARPALLPIGLNPEVSRCWSSAKAGILGDEETGLILRINQTAMDWMSGLAARRPIHKDGISDLGDNQTLEVRDEYGDSDGEDELYAPAVVELIKGMHNKARIQELLARTRALSVFHHAAMTNDTLFFSVALCSIPAQTGIAFLIERDSLGRTPIDNCELLHPDLARRLESFVQKQVIAPHTRTQAANMRFDSLVGQTRVIDQLKHHISALLENESDPINWQPVLLYGPPGTGKSFLAQCCAVEMTAPVVELKCDDLLGWRLGETEKQITRQFKRAAQSRPRKSVVVFNECDSLCGAPKDKDQAWAATLRKTLLDILDQLIDPNHALFGVKLMLTTNYLNEIDPAIRDRVETIEVPLPSASELQTLLPRLCELYVPQLDVTSVDWTRVAAASGQHLSVRGLKYTLQRGYQTYLRQNPQANKIASTDTVLDWILNSIGKIAPEPLTREENFCEVSIKHVPDEQHVALATALARAGWDFASAPSCVYRQVSTLNECVEPTTGLAMILKHLETGKLLTDVGCYATLRDNARSFEEYRVFVQCQHQDDGLERIGSAVSSVMLESYAKIGVRRLIWEHATAYELIPAPEQAMTIESVLAPKMKRFVSERVFVETRGDEILLPSPDNNNVAADLVVLSGDLTECLRNDLILLVLGPTLTAAMANRLGYRVFRRARSRDQMVDIAESALYLRQYDDENALIREDIQPGRVFVCSEFGGTVAEALRANGMYYAALHGVFVRRMRPRSDESAIDESEIYAIAIGAGTSVSALWTGKALAELERTATFRAHYATFSPCTSATQVLSQGTAIMIDLRKAHELPMHAREPPLNVALLRLYPVAAEGRTIRDYGYEDGSAVSGEFKRGWFRGGYYWRVSGKAPNEFIAAGTGGNAYALRIRHQHDLGNADTRILVEIPGYGICFCRGVYERVRSSTNPRMACVLFDENGEVKYTYAFLGLIGCWEDIL